MPVLFSLDNVPPAARAASLDAALSSYRIPLRMRLREQTNLRARVESVRLGETEVESFSITGATGSVSRAATGHDDPHLVTLHLVSSGNVELLQAGNRARPRIGDVVISSTRLPFTTAQVGACDQVTLSFREHELAVKPDLIRPVLGGALRAGDPIIQTISATLRSIAESALEHPGVNWAQLQESTSILARALVLHAVGGASTRGALTRSLQDRVFDHVRRNSADPELSATSVAAAHSISTRYLHLLFARRNITFTSWVRRHRVNKASKLLAIRPPLSIAEIAYTCGFADQSHFARTFKQELGCTPSDWRARCLSGNPIHPGVDEA